MFRRVLLKFMAFYQRYLTLLSYGSCRYYPTCSEYAKQQFQVNSLHMALYRSITRILSCNQLFDGGIDYPVVNKVKKTSLLCQRPISLECLRYWLVPKKRDGFYVIKNFTFNKETSC